MYKYNPHHLLEQNGGDKNPCRGGLSAVEKDIPPFFLKDNIIAKPLSSASCHFKESLGKSSHTNIFFFVLIFCLP